MNSSNTSQYRVQGSSLYELQKDGGGREIYVHVYKNDRLKTEKALVKAYLESCEY